MIKTKQIEVKSTEKKVIEASCDFCGKKFDKVTVDCCGYGHLGISFGYGSKFDDNQDFLLHICDDCFIEKFGNKLIKQFKKKEYNLNKLKKDYPNLKIS